MNLRSIVISFLLLTAACGARASDAGDGEPSRAVTPLAASNPPAAPLPSGVWTMTVQYGPVGVPVTPTIPLQLEVRPDGTAYRWVCSGAPDDGSLSAPCAPSARSACERTTVAWDGARWRLAMAPQLTLDQGAFVPDGEGRVLIPYINPSYSGALFARVGEPDASGAACAP